jgi:hypothetical protein
MVTGNLFPAKHFCHRDHRDHREKNFFTSVSSVANKNLFDFLLQKMLKNRKISDIIMNGW